MYIDNLANCGWWKRNMIQTNTFGTYMSLSHDVMLTQMSAKKWIKQFVEWVVADIFKYYQQLNYGSMPGNTYFGEISNE